MAWAYLWFYLHRVNAAGLFHKALKLIRSRASKHPYTYTRFLNHSCMKCKHFTLLPCTSNMQFTNFVLVAGVILQLDIPELDTQLSRR
ncbi:hypothetical protein F4604DRAFT_515760 [Suillus subluteus]|nr:hypothetical protein F4604DRAFT_515760 [Suillus subluteus]